MAPLVEVIHRLRTPEGFPGLLPRSRFKGWHVLVSDEHVAGPFSTRVEAERKALAVRLEARAP